MKEQQDQGQAQEDEAAQALRSHQERKADFYTILVSGVDDGNGNSDTNILVAVDAAEGFHLWREHSAGYQGGLEWKEP